MEMEAELIYEEIVLLCFMTPSTNQDVTPVTLYH
jgi:hypothetical protein